MFKIRLKCLFGKHRFTDIGEEKYISLRNFTLTYFHFEACKYCLRPDPDGREWTSVYKMAEPTHAPDFLPYNPNWRKGVADES